MSAKMVPNLLRFVFGIASLISWGNYAIARSNFMSSGSPVKDALHAVELDQHGSISYITNLQSHVLSFWIACSMGCFLVTAAIGARGRLRYLVKH